MNQRYAKLKQIIESIHKILKSDQPNIVLWFNEKESNLFFESLSPVDLRVLFEDLNDYRSRSIKNIVEESNWVILIEPNYWEQYIIERDGTKFLKDEYTRLSPGYKITFEPKENIN